MAKPVTVACVEATWSEGKLAPVGRPVAAELAGIAGPGRPTGPLGHRGHAAADHHRRLMTPPQRAGHVFSVLGPLSRATANSRRRNGTTGWRGVARFHFRAARRATTYSHAGLLGIALSRIETTATVLSSRSSNPSACRLASIAGKRGRTATCYQLGKQRQSGDDDESDPVTRTCQRQS